MISVDEYLNKLKRASRSPQTIKGYQKVFKSFAEYRNVPVGDLHKHLTSDSLASYAAYRIEKGKSPAGTQTNLRILHKFFTENGIVIGKMDMDIIKNPGVQDEDGDEDIGEKPLTLELLQKMIDQGNPHSRAIITFLCSTASRAGETSKLVLLDIGRLDGDKFVPDLEGSVIKIPNKIAKGRVKNGKKTGGGYVFLNAEARQYLTIWLKERDAYIAIADRRSSKLRSGPKPKDGEEDTRPHVTRPANDKRIFAISYTSMHRIWDRLYNRVDGEPGTYRARCTLHSCRRFFRTNAVKTMSLDLVEKIMRHSDYLGQYIQIPDMEKQFHEGEAALYITRADHRITSGKMAEMERKYEDQQKTIEQLKKYIEAKKALEDIKK